MALGGRAAAWLGVALVVAAAVTAHAETRTGLACSAIGFVITALRPQVLAAEVIGPLVVDVLPSVPGFLIAWHSV